jgi:hypothetical protein
VWQRDEDVKACPVCARPFGALRWRHHCRVCMRVVCDDCSPRAVVEGLGAAAVRRCLLCFHGK